MCKILKILGFLLKRLWEATLKKAFVCIDDSKWSCVIFRIQYLWLKGSLCLGDKVVFKVLKYILVYAHFPPAFSHLFFHLWRYQHFLSVCTGAIFLYLKACEVNVTSLYVLLCPQYDHLQYTACNIGL